MNKAIKTRLEELYKQQKAAIKDWDNDALRDINTQIFNITEQLKKANQIRIEEEREKRIALRIEKKLNKETQKWLYLTKK